MKFNILHNLCWQVILEQDFLQIRICLSVLFGRPLLELVIYSLVLLFKFLLNLLLATSQLIWNTSIFEMQTESSFSSPENYCGKKYLNPKLAGGFKSELIWDEKLIIVVDYLHKHELLYAIRCISTSLR